MKCKVESKVIAASMAVAMVITMAGCGSSGKKVEATKIDVTFDLIEVGKDYTDIKADLKFLTHKTDVVDTKFKEYVEEFQKLYPNVNFKYGNQTFGIPSMANVQGIVYNCYLYFHQMEGTKKPVKCI
ncbi:hypothetical protein AAAW13_06030 [Fusicatenibacter saccharivorans]|uniref:hypothetical protein n=1 Tax=Fusicatenibacter saccharivorans TaxID=1150298 RepID=UPI0032C0B157